MLDACISTTLMTRGCARFTQLLSPFVGAVAGQALAVDLTQALIDGRGDPMSAAMSVLRVFPPDARRIVAARLVQVYAEATA